MRKSRQSLLLLSLFFLSGACGLIYEVLWLRMFTSAFGMSLYATSAVLAAFMGGLALGSYLFGRWIELRWSPMRVYAYLEIGVGICALLIPYLLGHLPALYKMVYLHVSEEFALILVLRFATSFIILLLPASLMGATLPVLSKLFTGDIRDFGKQAGRLYAVNTFGAVTGTLATGFLLIPYLGVSTTNFLAASLNFLIGIAALALAGRFEALPRTLDGAGAADDPTDAERTSHRETERLVEDGSALWMLPLIGISGFSALSYEVIWMRLFSIITYDTVFAYTSTLAAFLTGIALGGYLFSRLLAKRTDLWRWFAAFQFGIGVFAILSPLLFANLDEHFGRHSDLAAASSAESSWIGVFLFKQFFVAVLFMLFPTVLMGASVPLGFKIYAFGRGKFAAGVGSVYACNTLGAIAGATMTGLLFVPLLGFRGALLIGSSLNLLAAAVGLHFATPQDRRRPVALALLSLVVLSLAGLSTIRLVTVDSFFRTGSKGEGALVFQQEDTTGLVEVLETDSGIRSLFTNRTHSWGSNSPTMVRYMKKQGYLPLLLHPRPESVVEIGMATGIGFTPAVRYDKVKEAEMVEISPAIAAAARLFDRELFDSPKFHLILEDGRNYLMMTPRNYDVIILGLFTPYSPGSGYLFTREFYTQCRDKLKPGGMVMQWLPLRQLTTEGLEIVVNTFRSVYSYVYVWEWGQYIGLLGLDAELHLDFTRFRASMQDPSIRDDLEKWDLADPYYFLSTYLMGPEEVKRFSQDAELNTEDRLRVEFSRPNIAQPVADEYTIANLLALSRYESSSTEPFRDMNDAERSELRRYREARVYSLQAAFVYQPRNMHPRAYEEFLKAERINPNDEIAKGELKKYRKAIEARGATPRP